MLGRGGNYRAYRQTLLRGAEGSRPVGETKGPCDDSTTETKGLWVGQGYVHVLMPGSCFTLYGKRVFADGIKLGILR